MEARGTEGTNDAWEALEEEVDEMVLTEALQEEDDGVLALEEKDLDQDETAIAEEKVNAKGEAEDCEHA